MRDAFLGGVGTVVLDAVMVMASVAVAAGAWRKVRQSRARRPLVGRPPRPRVLPGP
ncbi:MAG: hypothetical protein ACREPI_05665 [Candidatus Dormibacterales bacterium]